jgi:putative SOS response-associated peptidase YedK
VEFTSQDAVEWMSATQAPLELFASDHQPRFTTVRVSTRVNSVRNNDSDLLKEDFPPEDESGELTLF